MILRTFELERRLIALGDGRKAEVQLRYLGSAVFSGVGYAEAYDGVGGARLLADLEAVETDLHLGYGPICTQLPRPGSFIATVSVPKTKVCPAGLQAHLRNRRHVP